MRVRAAALVCLLAVLSALAGCGNDDDSTAADRPSSITRPSPVPALLEEPGMPPQIVVSNPVGSLQAKSGSYCWQSNGAGSCVDAASIDPHKLPTLSGPGPATFEFPVEGWSFTATFHEVRDHPFDARGDRVDVEQPEPGQFTFAPPPGAGDFQVDLFGDGPQGDYSAALRWQVPPDGTNALSEASCVAPYLDDRPPTTPPRPHTLVVAAGSTFQLHGHAFFTGCNDTGGGEIGTAMRDVGMRVTYADGRSIDLGPFTPDGGDFSFTTNIDVPEDAPAGVATAYAATARFEFTVRR